MPPRTVDPLSGMLLAMRNESDGASSSVTESITAYNGAVTEYNLAHPNDHQIPTVSGLPDINDQVALMIVAAQAEANTLSTTVDTLADVYTMLQSEFGGG